MLEAAMTNAAHEGEQQAVYTLNQLHSYHWLAQNAAFAAMLLATGLGARRNRMLPTSLAWATIVIGASLLTPLGYFGFYPRPSVADRGRSMAESGQGNFARTDSKLT